MRLRWLGGVALVLSATGLSAGAASGNGDGRAPTIPQEPAALVTEMARAFDRVTDYECRVRAHIVNGKEATNITGDFYFRRPRQVLFKLGIKGGIVFKKDGRIRGWFVTRALSHGHRPEDRILHDVRGRRIDQYVLGDLIAELQAMVGAGAPAAVRSDSRDGKDFIALDVAPVTGSASFTQRRYWIDREAMLPVGYQTFDGTTRVEDVWCNGLKVNGGLKDEFFD
jgi:outer membrane lipoprotein-sorting protein